VQSNGLIEKVRTNLALQSNTFSTTWTNNNSTETSGQAGYDGTNNAWFLTAANTTTAYITQSIVFTGVSNYSVYLKKGTSSFAALTIEGVNGGYSYFDLNTGALGAAVGVTASIQSIGNGWYRCSISAAASLSGASVRIYVTDADNSTSVTNGNNILIQAAQVETGDIATDYIATTTAAVSVGPVSGLPRLDYLGSTCPRLLLEPQRSNSAQYSEQLDNAWWTKNNQSVTANNTTAPDGYSSADLVIPAAGTADHYILSSTVNSTASEVVTLSLFIKKKDNDYFYFGTGGASAFGAVVYRFSTNTFTVSGLGATATNYGNGWIRLTITGTTGATDLRMLFTPTDATGSRTFNANGTDGTWVWGCQVEAGAYATSYIPTLGASVTRVADLCNKTSVSSLIGQTEGTIFAEVSFDDIGAAGASSYIYISDGSFANSVIVGREPASPNSKFFFYIQASSVAILNNTTNNITSGVVKMAVAYKSGDWAAYLNGNLVASGSTTFTFNASINRFAIGPNDGAQTIVGSSARAAQALLFKTRLTNAQLAELTA
jgi:hypothetical protein